MSQDQTTAPEDGSGTYSFDKFMDAILVEEARFRRDRRPPAQDEPQRRRAWLRQERPLSRTYVRPTAGGR